MEYSKNPRMGGGSPLRRYLIFISIITVLLFHGLPALACTSYAVYSNEAIYGMNYDWGLYPETRLFVGEEGEMRFFTLQYYFQGGWRTICMMNSEGLFTNYQTVPSNVIRNEPDDGTETIFQDAVNVTAIRDYSHVSQVEDLIAGKYIRSIPIISLHSLFADPDGNAMILELVEGGHEVVKMEGNFLVMANFFNSEYRGVDYSEISGPGGVYRFRKVYEGLLANMGKIDIATGFSLLESAMQTSTRYSMVFKPEEKAVYFSLERDFNRIWRADLEQQTLETWQGFTEYRKVDITQSSPVYGQEIIKWK
ncbi:MAG: hypothetical protein UMV23_01880 [Halanaerobium sp.]|nr:hypothetical protein [Halanaerobium sp.]